MGNSTPSTNVKVSVIVPVYNVIDYLPNFITMLKKQDLADIEILLIDDGSTDGSAEILDDLTMNHPSFSVIHQPNSGVAAARNRGLQMARGQYICFIDPDDAISANYFEDLKSAAENTQADLYITDWHKIKDTSVEKHSLSEKNLASHLDSEIVLRTIMRSDTILGSLWAKVFSRRLFAGNAFPDQKTSSDFVPCVRAISNARTIVYVPQIHYDYTANRTTSLQNSQQAEDIEDSVKVHRVLSQIVSERFPRLRSYAPLDLLGSRMQACIHACRSTKIDKDHKRTLFRYYKPNLIHDVPLVLRNSGTMKYKLLFTFTALGYFPTTLVLKAHSYFNGIGSHNE